MGWFREELDRCEAVVRSRLEPEEGILAVGRCEDITDLGGIQVHRVPAHRFLWFEWGNAIAYATFVRTRLAFSRPNTAAAIALREQLASRMVPVDLS